MFTYWVTHVTPRSVLFDSGQAALLGGFVLFFLNYMPYSYIFLPDVYETLTL